MLKSKVKVEDSIVVSSLVTKYIWRKKCSLTGLPKFSPIGLQIFSVTCSTFGLMTFPLQLRNVTVREIVDRELLRKAGWEREGIKLLKQIEDFTPEKKYLEIAEYVLEEMHRESSNSKPKEVENMGDFLTDKKVVGSLLDQVKEDIEAPKLN